MTRYIGKEPSFGNFVKLDAITVVNGQAAYTMQNGSSNFTNYDNANQFIVSLNGVIQAPTDSFTVSGSTITFSSALSTGDVIDFILVLGDVLSVGTPSDNTVATATLQDNAVQTAKINDDAVTKAKVNFISDATAGVEVKGDGGSNDGYIQLNCSQNSHGIKLASPNHSSGQSYTLTFPGTAPATNKILQTDGSGNLSFIDTPSGGMELLNTTLLGSDATEIVVDNVFTSSHDIYRFFLYNMKTDTNADIHFQLRYGGASGTNDGTANYKTRNHYAYNNSDGQQQNSHSDGFAILNGWTDLDSNVDFGTSVEMTLFDPVDQEKYTTLMAHGTMYSGDGSYNEIVNTMMGWFTAKTYSHTGFRIHASSGNMKQYTKLLTYGMKL